MATINFESLAKPVSDAVNAENAAAGKWVKASDAAYMAGIRAPMLDKKSGDKDIKAGVERLIIAAFTPKVQTLLALSGAGLTGLNEVDRSERRYWKQRIGTMMSRLASYLRAHEDQTRGTAERLTVAERLDRDLKEWQSHLKKLDDADFDIPEVIEALQAVRDLI